MNRAIGWLARNPVAANLLMMLIVVSGFTGAAAVTEEVMPEIDLRRIGIQVPYLGAAPEEVESGVVVRIEEAVQNIDGVRQIVSTASEGGASVIVELESGADSQRVFDEVTNNVQAITTFPVETEKPIIRELISRNQVTDIAIAGATDVATLKSIAERVRDGLFALPKVGQVEIVSVPPYEISIEVSELALRRHRITFDQVANAVRRSSLDLPGGSVRSARGEILLRTVGQAYRGEDYESLVLWTRPDGSRLLLGDVATVVDGFAETDQRSRFDDVPAVTVSVYRSGEQSALDVAAAVRGYVRRADAWLPAGITMTIWQDQSEVLTDRLAIMAGNGAAGFVLVFVVLTLFLNIRLAFWVSLGIPICFLGAFALMPNLGLSLNMVSCFPFILVIGIVVDDAIIVGENIHRHQQRHADSLRGAIEGAREIGKPVVYAVLTTAAAFLPLLCTGGFRGAVPGRSAGGSSVPALLPARVARHPAGPPGARPAPRPGQPVAPVPAAHRRRTSVDRPHGLRTGPGRRAPLALRHGGNRIVHPDPQRRRRARRLGQLPVCAVGRERIHDRLDHDAAGHAGRGHLGGGREIRGGSRTAPREVGSGDRRRLLSARVLPHLRMLPAILRMVVPAVSGES